MEHKKKYRTSDIPNKPGVYVFRDRFRNVIYVGKAKALRKRLAHYFQASRRFTTDAKLRSLINCIEYYELFPVRTEEEAILLESRFVKQYSPRYNVVLRDDKRFLLIKIDINSPFPKLQLARLKKDDGCKYYGPFPQAGVLRETIDCLTRHFGLRSCRPEIPGEKERKHCLDHIVRYCSAPCVNKINIKGYHQLVGRLVRVIEGDIDEIVHTLTEKMNRYAIQQNYESAARLRDVIENIKTVFGAQNRTFVNAPVNRYPGLEAVRELQRVLGLSEPPNVIECFDISNISGSFAVGSMVRFTDGVPAHKDYRHFRIKQVAGIDDFAMMNEVVGRRLKRLDLETNRLPDLIIVDGGLGQLSAAYRALTELGLTKIPLAGLAKKQEEIFVTRSTTPIVLEAHEASLKLLQCVRDEAHRFANSFHQGLRRKRIRNSLLDEIPGIGSKRKQQLLKCFGSVTNIRKHTAKEISSYLPGIGYKLADEILSYVKGNQHESRGGQQLK